MRQVIARIKNHWFNFGSGYRQAQIREFLKRHEGKEVTLTITEENSVRLRRFFEGAVVKYVFYQHMIPEWKNFKDCREALKLEFNRKYAIGVDGQRKEYAGSTKEMTKQEFREFVDKITTWMMQNGYEVPDPEEFKRWRDSAPEPGEIYPPVKRLQAIYEREIGKSQR